jgi:hypothetical protein
VALGIELTVNWYFRFIIRDFAELETVASEVLPINRSTCGDFMVSRAVYFIDDLLSGLEDTNLYDDIIWGHHLIFEQFKGHVLSEERQMEKMLAEMRYRIDQENALTLVTGKKRPQTVGIQALRLCHMSKY